MCVITTYKIGRLSLKAAVLTFSCGSGGTRGERGRESQYILEQQQIKAASGTPEHGSDSKTIPTKFLLRISSSTYEDL